MTEGALRAKAISPDRQEQVSDAMAAKPFVPQSSTDMPPGDPNNPPNIQANDLDLGSSGYNILHAMNARKSPTSHTGYASADLKQGRSSIPTNQLVSMLLAMDDSKKSKQLGRR